MKTMNPATGRRAAQAALGGVSGIDSIGITWDGNGQPVVRVDLRPEADRSAVEKRLTAEKVPYILRTVTGKVTAL
ncbi:hypothetical protein [Methylobacterium sp. ID0610]|uniref:hypothetical protein n=1 Tax=Methylobacterium carpenticola TaxID=3344827 RepID=UPI0036D0F5DC